VLVFVDLLIALFVEVVAVAQADLASLVAAAVAVDLGFILP
jgi:hypothetical protein